jgi:hypothetical protein
MLYVSLYANLYACAKRALEIFAATADVSMEDALRGFGVAPNHECLPALLDSDAV